MTPEERATKILKDWNPELLHLKELLIQAIQEAVAEERIRVRKETNGLSFKRIATLFEKTYTKK